MTTATPAKTSSPSRPPRSASELNAFERRWKTVFALAAMVLVICLLAWLLRPFTPGLPLATIYSLGGFAGAVALYAAGKLRDAERVDAVVDGLWLDASAAPGVLADLDD